MYYLYEGDDVMPIFSENYKRDRAVEYADFWAYRRNPEYYSFSGIGGDCTNFVSQCIYYANGVMNYTKDFGWYYIDINDRAAAWTGVDFFYNFITTNEGVGPYGEETSIENIEIGDVIQMQFNDDSTFQHTVIVMSIDGEPSPETIRVAAHSNDSNCRQLDSYQYQAIRFLHILGVRKEFSDLLNNIIPR